MEEKSRQAETTWTPIAVKAAIAVAIIKLRTVSMDMAAEKDTVEAFKPQALPFNINIKENYALPW